MKKFSFGVCFILLAMVFSGFAPKPQQKESVRLPILMYHSVTSCGKSEYIVTEKQFERDIVALVKEGYHTVSVKQLYDYTDGVGDLPDKPILLTFDDGHYNTLSAALPILQKYGCVAQVNVIGKFSQYASESGDNHHPEYSYLTWDDIRELYESGVFEIGSHTYNMHNYSPRFGIGRIAGEDDATYVENLRKDVGRLNKILAGEGIECTVFAYPFGRYNTLAQNTLISMGFRMTLTCFDGVNTIEKGNPKSLIHLKRFNRASSLSTSQVFALLRK